MRASCAGEKGFGGAGTSPFRNSMTGRSSGSRRCARMSWARRGTMSPTAPGANSLVMVVAEAVTAVAGTTACEALTTVIRAAACSVVALQMKCWYPANSALDEPMMSVTCGSRSGDHSGSASSTGYLEGASAFPLAVPGFGLMVRSNSDRRIAQRASRPFCVPRSHLSEPWSVSTSKVSPRR